MRRVGIILLDGAEVIIRMYEIYNTGNNKLLQSTTRDLANLKPGNQLKASDVVEVIAETYFTGHSMAVNDWKICARHIPEATIQHISSATGVAIETLTLSREQEILCIGLLTEF